MAVIKSKRSESEMKFVHTARQLQIYTIQKVVNFPKRYTFYVSQPIANAATRIHECVKMANSIYPLNQHEAQMRRDYLLRANAELNSLASQLEITLNVKKTQIVPLRHGFTFLKVRFYLTDSGRIVRKIYRRSVTKMRRKLKALRRMLDEGRVEYADVYASWQSWKSYAQQFDAYRTVQSMGKLYNDLFAKDWLIPA